MGCAVLPPQNRLAVSPDLWAAEIIQQSRMENNSGETRVIIGLGIDMVETDRIERIWSRFGRKFSDRILTAEEAANLPNKPAEYLAARFAAKEAGVKALGTGFTGGITFLSLAVRRLETGKPELELNGRAMDRAETLGVGRIHLSLTHTRIAAAAVVVLET
jgi:holo-[acyl-carrier protein] synthase